VDEKVAKSKKGEEWQAELASNSESIVSVFHLSTVKIHRLTVGAIGKS
jgi:hypothetical protein